MTAFVFQFRPNTYDGTVVDKVGTADTAFKRLTPLMSAPPG
jgi:hypothetical protein